MEGLLAVVFAFAACCLMWAVLAGGNHDARDRAFDEADRICAARGGAKSYDIEGRNTITYQCRDGIGRIATLDY